MPNNLQVQSMPKKMGRWSGGAWDNFLIGVNYLNYKRLT